jgi:hypothetical protein
MAKPNRRNRAPARRPKPARRKARKPKKTVRASKQRKVPIQARPFPSTIFTVANDDLGRLTPAGAVELLRDILWADARRAGLATTRINVSAWVDVPDGGIDASVAAEPASLKGSVIKSHRLGFQVKAGSGFQPWREAHIRAELFGDQPIRKTNLGTSVRACLDEGGTYVLVCTGVDLPDAQQRQAVGHLMRLFTKSGYKRAKVEVWSQNKLIGLVEPFPSLRLKVNGKAQSTLQTHKSWSRQEDMRKAFQAGEDQRKFVTAVRTELNRTDEAVHISVTGEPGVGKTRAVLEATGAEDLMPVVVYCDYAAKFRDSELMHELLKEDNHFAVILVVDECDADARSYIWNKLKNQGPRIKFISIYNEPDETSGNTVYVDAPALGKEQIIAILKEYGVPTDRVERWVEFCSGSPRVAHVIGANLKSNPEDVLKSPDTVDVWARYIVGRENARSEPVRQRRIVLEHLALFKRFGFGPRVSAEAKAIAAIIRQAEPAITVSRFEEIVRELRLRKILQGENTLYITPKALHIKLWADWWDTHGGSFEPEAFAAKLDGNLVAWFDEMFKYAAQSDAALGIVARLLGGDGPFRDGSYLQERRGARLFLALTEADPKRALECLKRTIGTWSPERLLAFTEGRREVVWALERIVIWRELFSDAARLLLQLAESENETWGNNASGIFAGLFSPGYGAVAPTEASLEERFPILKEALESKSRERRRVALKAADVALKTHHFSRVVGAELQGLKREPKLWMPKTYGELFDGYRRVWSLVRDRLEHLPEDERQKAIGVLLNHARGLAGIQNVQAVVIETLTELAEKPYCDRKEIVGTIERILHYDGKALPTEVQDRWRALRDSLIGTDFHALMERYVAMDLLEDKVDDDGNPVDKVGPKIEELAGQVLRQPSLLDGELPWLVSNEAKNGFRFGYALGSGDSGWSQLPKILEALRNSGESRSAFFVGGYFRALRERDSDLSERALDDLANDERLRNCVPELTWRSGPSDRSMLRVLDLAGRGLIPVASFHMFAFGGVVQALAEDTFNPIVEFLLETGERDGVLIALDLYHFYYAPKESKRPLPKELTLRLLTAPQLFVRGARQNRSNMQEYDWTEIGKAFVRTHPEASLQLADVMLEHFGEDGTMVEGFHSQSYAVLNEIVARFPAQVWQRITKYLGPPVDERAYHLKSWLHGEEFHERGQDGVLPLIPLDEMWRWVDQDIEARAWYLASMVPRQLFRQVDRVCLAREVLVRYGQRDDVRNELMANFSTEGWSGPESLHYEAKKQELLNFRKDETDPNVTRWIDDYVVGLDRQIERAQIEEEREH